MGFYASSCLVEEDTHPKNRVVGSERFSFDRARKTASQPLESHQEITITLTIFVSDRQSFWTVDAWQGDLLQPATLNKYLYGTSNPVHFVDPSGEFPLIELVAVDMVIGILANTARPSASMGTCGQADVTGMVNLSLQQIDAKYSSWSTPDRKSHCRALYGPGAVGAWDIWPLYEVGRHRWPFLGVPRGTQRCQDTVVFKGKCYRGGAVNYVMWGRMNALCHGDYPSNPMHTLAGARALVFEYKGAYLWAHHFEAQNFTTYGWNNGGSAPACAVGFCKIAGTAPQSWTGWYWNSL